MTCDCVKQPILSSALSNYLRTFVGIVVGLVTFRLLYQALPRESFGFWSLFWSVFGYGILLDFGFGFAAQKRVAELSFTGEWHKLSQVLSSILFFYLGVAALMAGTVALGDDEIVRSLGVSSANHVEIRIVQIIFFAAIGLAFPLAIIPDILRSQQRISTINNIITMAMLMRLAVVAWAVYAGWSLLAIMLTALLFALAPDLVSAFFALRHMPEAKLLPGMFSKSIMRATMSFSIFALGAPLLFPDLQIENTSIRIFLMGSAGGLTSLLCLWSGALTASERQWLRSRLPSPFKKFSPVLQAA